MLIEIQNMSRTLKCVSCLWMLCRDCRQNLPPDDKLVIRDPSLVSSSLFMIYLSGDGRTSCVVDGRVCLYEDKFIARGSSFFTIVFRDMCCPCQFYSFFPGRREGLLCSLHYFSSVFLYLRVYGYLHTIYIILYSCYFYFCRVATAGHLTC